MRRRADEFLGLCEVENKAFCNEDGFLNALREHSATVVIFNFCFSLGAETFRGNISKLCNELKGAVEKVHPKHVKRRKDGKVISAEKVRSQNAYADIVYQNPVDIDHRNWKCLKNKKQKTGFSPLGVPKEVSFGRQNPVYCDILRAYWPMRTKQQDLPLPETASDYEGFQPVVSNREIQKVICKIPELEYKLDYITETEEAKFLHWIDQQTWITELKRRVQHYGWKYDYKARKVRPDMRIGDLPETLASLADELHKDGFIDYIPDQVIVNEYIPGQGIASHIDCEPCFGDTILTMSLGSGCVMEFIKAERKGGRLDFKKPARPEEKIPVWLEPRSVVSMRGDSRWWWFHGIPARKSDKWNDKTYQRSLRVSLTFRKVVFEK